MADKKAAIEKKDKAPEKKPAKAQNNNVRLPILWEVVITFARLIVTLLGLSVAAISYLNGTGLLMSVVRAGAAMLCVGLVLWFIYWQVARGTLDLMFDLYVKRQKEVENQTAASSTVQFNG